ncbi:hypothetical protein VE01_10337 [Pseudogymnoascus verrucosus]|uniref:Uncharacterized protein n=1 Tax=Pseudogymnoascus verrucosus TaxID=342668 RepID=A0A1B8G768_9PEZI|nr:uncharacterized protein VE01_10337 [Pseudogymnoascus verrucosus]OBT91679.1 hypothetical protein VE01_10337 [Pseudogymnoascus verrucosus]
MHFPTLLLIPILLGLAAADTLTLDLHANNFDDASFQTFKVSNLHNCHNSNQKFEYYLQHDIAQSLFERNLGIRAYGEPNCQGPSSTHPLSNANGCVHGARKSFQLLEM